ncbi:MAG: AEC family transporter [Rhodobacteraceae bacterium]|nr:AEC family transporter [Paracoccaceae bacterium]
MQALVSVILPVFLVIGFGYVVRWRDLIRDEHVDGLMLFTQNFAIPCLLFVAIARLDLGQDFDWRLLVSFYTGALAGFAAGVIGARLLFRRDWEDSIAIGFICLFSNSLLLGLPITERAYGADALAPNYAIIALHSPICYAVGITAMEVVRNRGVGMAATARRTLTAMFRNALVIGIGLGFVVNLGGIPLPQVLNEALELMARAAIPAALFGLGAVLYRYRPDGDWRTIGYAVAVSLLLHPAIVWAMGRGLALDPGPFNSAVITAAMAPGVNAYVFANMYGRARRVAASSVLLGTALCALTVWVWLEMLG